MPLVKGDVRDLGVVEAEESGTRRAFGGLQLTWGAVVR